MDSLPIPPNNTRLGFHYFPDTFHYREGDLAVWLPEIQALKASWITLIAPIDRAIPESFMRSLLSSGIEPILHFHMPLDQPIRSTELRLLFETYANWGAHYVVLFDRPNTRNAWGASSWAQSNLVERFLDIYLPLAEAAVQCGLIPVFPPLEPGGDYWDTAFLKAALQGIQRRNQAGLLEKLVVGAYAWACNRYLNWGAGGPERWPATRPYYTPPGSEDQRGFRIFDWYQTIAQSITNQPCHILLLAAGCCPGDHGDLQAAPIDEKAHTYRNMALAALMLNLDWDSSTIRTDHPNDDGTLEAVPPEVLTCNFWLLSAGSDNPNVQQAWYQPDGKTLPIVGALRDWLSEQKITYGIPLPYSGNAFIPELSPESKSNAIFPTHPFRPDCAITHYLLLPAYEWGVADWHLEVIRPFVKKYKPTVGFSLAEATRAWRVTVVGGPQSFPDTILDQLRLAGCVVEQISGDGTSIASQLATL